MAKGFLFIANGRVVPLEQEQSLEPIKTGSFEAPAMYAADCLGLKLYMGINRNHAEQLKSLDYDITFYNQHIYRSIFGFKDLKIGYKNLCQFLESHPDVEVIHCNTPIGGVLGRICGHKYKKKVIYTTHGFHFFKDAPFVNLTIFKWIEQWMAHYTDAIITINQEDYEAAKNLNYKKGGKAYHVPGVGVDTKAYMNVNVDKTSKFNEIGLHSDARVGIIVGDLNDNKNVETLVKALPKTPDDFHVIVCGFGPNEETIKALSSQLGVSKRVHFLGFRSDIKELYAISDMFLFASKREGLPRSIMEAMCMGLPCVVSKIRGNIDLIEEGKGGYLVDPMSYKEFSQAINKVLENQNQAESFGQYNKQKIKEFDIVIVKKKMVETFKEILK